MMATRLELRAKTTYREHRHLRFNNPLAATLTTPGGGKSFFLDELAALHDDDLEKLCSDHQELKEILQNSVSNK